SSLCFCLLLFFLFVDLKVELCRPVAVPGGSMVGCACPVSRQGAALALWRRPAPAQTENPLWRAPKKLSFY
ncbi:hypothetical protein ACV357_35875, partial [Pseudomonas aeruginosa]